MFPGAFVLNQFRNCLPTVNLLFLDTCLLLCTQVVVCHDDDLSRVTETEYHISDFNYKVCQLSSIVTDDY